MHAARGGDRLAAAARSSQAEDVVGDRGARTGPGGPARAPTRAGSPVRAHHRASQADPYRPVPSGVGRAVDRGRGRAPPEPADEVAASA